MGNFLVRFLRKFIFVATIAISVMFNAKATPDATYPFEITTTSMTANDTFKWSISASGTFYVDCGDGGVLSGYGVSGNTITRSNTTMAQYTCTYPTAGTHTIRLGGAATGYNATSGSSASYAAIGFSTSNYSNNTPTKIAGISGSLGAIFGTIGTGDTLATQPRFTSTFRECSGLTGSIPENLFAGISGAPAERMFYYTFSGCSGLTGSIPANLFAGISGAPAKSMFYQTFYNCSGLTGSIPENLFVGIKGAPAEYMFNATFYNCSGLSGAIPANLFAGISGAPASWMFDSTFDSCSGLTGSIPENLFAGISGAPAEYMFGYTFFGCRGLTGSIPENLFAGISGAPANGIFNGTFQNCSGLTEFTDGTNTVNYVPVGFLSGITTSASPTTQASSMFTNTGLASTCPSGTTTTTRSNFTNAGKPWCTPCPDGTTSSAGATSVDQCITIEQYECENGGGTWDDGEGICKNNAWCEENYGSDYYWNGSDCTYACPTYSTNSQGGTRLLSNGALAMEIGGFDLDGNGTCVTAIAYVQDPGTGNISDISFDDNNVSMMYCVYNSQTGNYDYACTQKAAICSPSEAQTLLQKSDNELMQTYINMLNLTESDMQNPMNLLRYTVESNDIYERCETSVDDCPTITPNVTFQGIPVWYGSFNGITINLLPIYITKYNGECVIPGIFGNNTNNLFYMKNYTEFVDMIDSGTQPTNDIKVSPLLELCSTDMTSLPSMTPEQVLEWYQTQLQSNASDGLIVAVNNGYLDSNGFFTVYSASEQNIIGDSLSTWYGAEAYRCPITCNAGEYLWRPIDEGFECSTCESGYYCPADSVTYTANEYKNLAETGSIDDNYDSQLGKTICPDNKTSPEGATSVEQCVIDASYTITLNTDSGTFPTGVVVPTEYNTISDLPLTLPTPTRDGYVFDGWYDNAELTGTTVTEIPSGSTGNKEYWAKWIDESLFKFNITSTSMTANDTFKFSISASGNFVVYCGDNGVLSGTGVSGNTITRSNTTMAQYTCTYPTAGTHTIRLGGAATGYNATSGSSASYAAIGFLTSNYSNNTPTKIAGISGSLGAIFGTIGTGDTLATQPRFIYTFSGCSGLSGSIPANLFAGISGAPAPYMFYNTFSNCSKLTGTIPANLFAGISGAPAQNMFSATFYNCGGLTGSIPANLFAGISGAPAKRMFQYTFYNCSGLTGSIPANLFAGISGAPAQSMFNNTFWGCSGLSGSIPENLFAEISGAPAQYMFYGTFNGCSGLSGFTDGTNTVNYVPGDFLSGITTASSPTNQAQNMFTSTGLASSCPSGTTNTTRSQFSDAGKPWCGASYTITYNLNDGAFPVGVVADTSYITEMTPKTLPTPIRDGYEFGGWYDNAEFTGNAITEIPSGTTGNKVYYAKWTDASVVYTITLNPNFDSGITATIYEKSGTGFFSDYATTTPITQVTPPVRSGYDFIGYYDINNTTRYIDENGNILANNTAFESDTTLYAQWGEVINEDETTTEPTLPDPEQPSSNWCPRYEDTPGYDPTHIRPIGTTGQYPAVSYYYYYYSPAGKTNKLGGCQLFFAMDNSLIPHVRTNISGYTHTMMRMLYNPETGNYDRAVQIQTGGSVVGNVLLRCSSGYTSKPTSNGLAWYATLPDALANACIPGYSITYNNMENATNNIQNLNGYPENITEAIILYDPTRDGFDFGGWYDNDKFTGEAITEIPSGSTGNKEFWAKWINASCPANYFLPSDHPEMCFPHVLHIGDNTVYLKSTKQTTPSLNVGMGNDVFYANMTTTATPMNSATEQYLKIMYNNTVYYVCDDTTYNQ